MYKKILVPVDGTLLSNATVEEAVQFAHSLGAQLTFFHARSDFGASSDGALLHATSPNAFAEGAAGNSKALLAKAESAARSAKVNCSSVDLISDHPHEAILNVALSQKCDLIFMASHGRRGIKGALLGSVTQKVLQKSTLPVLVSSVESNIAESDAQKALSIIKNEHRSLAAVVHGLKHLADEAKSNDIRRDFALLRAMLYYIEHFPEKLHHPKEEAYLFRLLRQRNKDCDAVMADLESQHAAGGAQFTALRAALFQYESGHPKGAAVFSTEVEKFSQMQWTHMEAEEALIFPLASQYLTRDDWREIASAFQENGDPRFGELADQPFDQLFTHLLNFTSGVTALPTGIAQNL